MEAAEPNAPLPITYHEFNYGKLMFIIDPNPGNTITIFEALETRKILHGSFEFAAWGFLIILNFITGRYFKESWKWAPFIHWVTGVLILVLNIGAFLLMFLLY